MQFWPGKREGEKYTCLLDSKINAQKYYIPKYSKQDASPDYRISERKKIVRRSKEKQRKHKNEEGKSIEVEYEGEVCHSI